MEVYHCRRNEEEASKLLKSRLELENFSGKRAKAVRQDFHAKVFLIIFCAAYVYPIEEKVIQEYKADEQQKYDQKINRANAPAGTQDMLIGLFIRKQYQKAIEAFDDILQKTREIIRPGRKESRRNKPKRLYSMNYKRL